MARRSTDDIHSRLLEVLGRHPDGISITSIRRELRLSATEQQHLDRRIRDLDAEYVIERERRGRQLLYQLKGRRTKPLDTTVVDKTTRARILHLAGHRCQMCGRNVAEDHVKLHIDHKIPRRWGGRTEDENLWALCSECNLGKQSFFASITDPRVRKAMTHSSVHVRLGELLKAFSGEPVPKTYLQIVAYTHDDFEKRLRELRELGWRYRAVKKKDGRRMRTSIVLEESRPWPKDPAAAIRKAERAKGKRR